MSFLVEDTQTERHAKIRSFLASNEKVIAVLLAAADFEWTVRRAILALGKSPNVDIRDGVLKHCSGLGGYKVAWTKEVKPRSGKGLDDIIHDWESFRNAYNLRHVLVHGVSGTTGKRYAEARIELILDASAAVNTFALQQGIDLFSRLPVRQRARKK